MVTELLSIYKKINKALVEADTFCNDIELLNIDFLHYNDHVKFGESQKDHHSLVSYYILSHVIVAAALHLKMISGSELGGQFSFFHLNVLKKCLELSDKGKTSRKVFLISCKNLIFTIDSSLVNETYNYIKNRIYTITDIKEIIKHLIEVIQCSDEQENIRDSIDSNVEKAMGKIYTPDPIIELMISMGRETILSKQINHVYALEPSCGPGLFLLSLVEDISNLKIPKNYPKIIVDAVDLDYKALLTTSLWIALVYIINPKISNRIKVNLYHDNFLFMDLPQKRYHLIIGNPPYIGERGFNKGFRRFLETNFSTFTGKADLYFAFLEKCITALQGSLCFLIPRYWLESNFGFKLRKYLSRNSSIDLIIDFQDKRLFEGKGIHSCILKLSTPTSKQRQGLFISVINANSSITEIIYKLTMLVFKTDDHFEGINVIHFSQNHLKADHWIFLSEIKNRLFYKIVRHKKAIKLADLAEIKEGINTGADRVSQTHLTKFSSILDSSIKKGDGIFVLSTPELEKLSLTENDKQFIKKWIKSSDVDRWVVKKQTKWIIYFQKDEIIQSDSLLAHLSKYKPILENRAEIKRNSRRKWYQLAWPRKKQIFENVKILLPYKSKEPKAVIDYDGFYTSADFRIITVKSFILNQNITNDNLNPLIITAILNSSIAKFYLRVVSKKLGKINDYYSYVINDLPIVYPCKKDEQILLNDIEKLLYIIRLNKQSSKSDNTSKDIRELENRIDRQIQRTYGLDEAETLLLF